ncbi:MAG: hypothetical protein ACYC5M_02935 [Anaerolineae bacterium]
MPNLVASSADAPTRAVLEEVPRPGFYEGGPRCPEDVILPSAMRIYMEYLNDPIVGCHALRTVAREPDWAVDCTYAFLVIASGLAFQQLWNPHAWDWREDPLHIASNPLEPLRRTIEATGYPYQIVANRNLWESLGLATTSIDHWGDEQAFRQRIVGGVYGQGRPLLALGAIGPPECCIVTGYDRAGEVLIGWNCFQAMPELNPDAAFEPTGYFRKEGWYGNTLSLIVLGDRPARPPQADSLCEALAWGVHLVRTPRVGDCYGGLAALSAWAQALEDDAAFDSDDMAMLRERYRRHHTTVGMVAEGR